MREGIFAALDAVEDRRPACATPTASAIASAAPCCRRRSPIWRPSAMTAIHSATFFAAQADFSEAGDLQVFMDEAQLEALEAADGGGRRHAGRPQDGDDFQHAARQRPDLVLRRQQLSAGQVARAVRSALLEFRHDAHAGGTASVLSARVLQGQRAGQGQMVLAGEKLDLAKVKLPIYLQVGQGRPHRPVPIGLQVGTRLFGGPIRFIIAGSGHIAGVINPPDAKKYQYWTNDFLPPTVEEWQGGAVEHPGSLVARLECMAGATVRPESAGAQAWQRQTETVGQCPGLLRQGQGPITKFSIWLSQNVRTGLPLRPRYIPFPAQNPVFSVASTHGAARTNRPSSAEVATKCIWKTAASSMLYYLDLLNSATSAADRCVSCAQSRSRTVMPD